MAVSGRTALERAEVRAGGWTRSSGGSTASASGTGPTRSTSFPARARPGTAAVCVLERAFADLGVLVVDYRRAYGRGVEFEHGLTGFICDFDAGRHFELLTRR